MEPGSSGEVCPNILSGPTAKLNRLRGTLTVDDVARLRDLKRRFDPDNRFRANINIQPDARPLRSGQEGA